ncbi:hypothetical protein ONA92_24220 [Mycobacteroides salmoniphilum]|uniref:P-loop ATPase, Sll1717 family n=1 Tax=Mycobacteroides salmoniphilum TaxID=404941 RepID=UPI003567AB47
MTDHTAGELSELKDLVRSISVGSRIAEQETENLSNYFVKTESWRQVRQGEVDIIFAPKGGGKSAIYSMLLSLADDFFDRNILLVTADNPQGDTAFSAVTPNTTEEEFRRLWKLYFIVLIADTFSSYSFNSDPAKRLLKILSDTGLLPNAAKWRRPTITKILDYIRRLGKSGVESIETSFAVGVQGATVTPKIVFRDTTEAERSAGIASLNDLMDLAQEALEYQEIKIWILLDRLDAAFLESPEFERNALRGLFRAYRDMDEMPNVSLRIFLRTDIWDSITRDGFREASHITRTLEIRWDSEDLLQLVIQRIAQSADLVEHYSTTQAEILSSSKNRAEFFYRVFPYQVDPGSKKPNTFEWCLTRTADGKGANAPRELIHLLEEVRSKQLKLFELGSANPSNETIFDRNAFKNALPAVSSSRIQQTLYAESPTLRDYIEALRGGKTRHNADSLMAVWGLSRSETLQIAESLVGVGFFEARADDFWVPFLYRPGLNLVQGSAAGVAVGDDD